ncbi:hypothetical protein RS1P1_44410 [Pseudomonas moraviensis]|nr:hypothetical protein RS1P1_44410 [Pseudomonas moraviensis]
MSEGGGQFVEPGTGYPLTLQASQAIERARGGFGVFRPGGELLRGAGTEIHQGTAQAEQYGSQTGRGDGQGFGVSHGNVPEITLKAMARG